MFKKSNKSIMDLITFFDQLPKFSNHFLPNSASNFAFSNLNNNYNNNNINIRCTNNHDDNKSVFHHKIKSN